tara:strand:- start:5289 stop:5933 length:645 start_codon:yes stop_codon:yes gene_type:complete
VDFISNEISRGANIMTIVYQGIHQFLDWFMGVTIALIIFYVIRLLFSLMGHLPEDKGTKGFDDLKGLFKKKAVDQLDEEKEKKAVEAVDKHVGNVEDAIASLDRASKTPTPGEANDFVQRAKHFLTQLRDSNVLYTLVAGSPYEEEAKLIKAEVVKLLSELQSADHTPDNLANLNNRLAAVHQSIEILKRKVAAYKKKTRKAVAAKLKGVVERK